MIGNPYKNATTKPNSPNILVIGINICRLEYTINELLSYVEDLTPT